MSETKLAALFLFANAIAVSACAMNPKPARDFQCNVDRGELLPPASGGAKALCGEIEEATANIGAAIRVSVRVLSPYALEAHVTAAGRDLPPIRMARSDRELGRPSLRRFAKSIATASAAALPE